MKVPFEIAHASTIISQTVPSIFSWRNGSVFSFSEFPDLVEVENRPIVGRDAIDVIKLAAVNEDDNRPPIGDRVGCIPEPTSIVDRYNSRNNQLTLVNPLENLEHAQLVIIRHHSPRFVIAEIEHLLFWRVFEIEDLGHDPNGCWRERVRESSADRAMFQPIIRIRGVLRIDIVHPLADPMHLFFAEFELHPFDFRTISLGRHLRP